MKKLNKKSKDNLATYAGLMVAVMTSWMLIDWHNFEFTPKNIFVLGISTLNAVAGWLTTFKEKE